jgi:hypothetical protein
MSRFMAKNTVLPLLIFPFIRVRVVDGHFSGRYRNSVVGSWRLVCVIEFERECQMEAAQAEGLLFPPMTGYAVFPWADAPANP